MSTSAQTQSEFGGVLANQLQLPFRMLTTLASDFDEPQARERAADLKPLVWYLGHIAITKDYFLTLYAGVESCLTPEFHRRFGRGSDGSADFGDAPSKEELVALLTRLHEQTVAFASTLELADMSRRAEAEVLHPLFARLDSALSLVTAHEAYHAGQVADLRRALGKDALFG